ncbi:MAG TPA: hypothetical protein VGL02_13220, partial [Streptomyces sp.]
MAAPADLGESWLEEVRGAAVTGDTPYLRAGQTPGLYGEAYGEHGGPRVYGAGPYHGGPAADPYPNGPY